MRLPVSLRQLEVFLTIADLGSFSLAAKQLHVSQPTLSRSVRITEDALEARLFVRDTRNLSLTPAGEELLAIARRSLLQLNEAFSHLTQFSTGRRGRIRVSALPSIGHQLLVGAIARFAQDYPEVSFLLRTEMGDALLGSIERGDADIAISITPPSRRDVDFEPLFEDAYVLLCRTDDPVARQFAPDQPVPWRIFADLPFVASAPATTVRATSDAVFAQLNLSVPPVHEVASLSTLGAVVEAGLGVTVWPKIATGLINPDKLTYRLLENPSVARMIGVITRRSFELSPAAQHFLIYLRDACAAVP